MDSGCLSNERGAARAVMIDVTTCIVVRTASIVYVCFGTLALYD